MQEGGVHNLVQWKGHSPSFTIEALRYQNIETEGNISDKNRGRQLNRSKWYPQ